MLRRRRMACARLLELLILMAQKALDGHHVLTQGGHAQGVKWLVAASYSSLASKSSSRAWPG